MVISALRKYSLTLSVVGMVGLSSLGDAHSSPAATIRNGGFETGNFSNWSTIGDSFVDTSEFVINPTEGSYSALLITGAAEDGELGAASDSAIETFLRLAPNSLDSLIGANAIEGSAIQQTFTAKAGDILSLSWNFLTNEATPETEGFNDFAFVSIAGVATKLADTSSSFFSSSANEFDQGTGFQTFSYTVTADGAYTLGLGVLDTRDNTMGSGLSVDNVKLESNIVSVPEPSSAEATSLLGTLAFGAGLAWKRKKQ